MSNSRTSNAGFGRDDMVALLGGGISDTLSAVAIKQNAANTASNKKDQETDLSNLTSAEAAALLQSTIGAATTNAATANRLRAHRPKKVLQHHILLEEAQKDIAQFVEEHQLLDKKDESHATDKPEDDNDYHNEEDEREFVAKKSKRQRQEPQIILQKPQPPSQQPIRKRRRHDSSSSSSDSEEEATRQKSDSSSDDDSEADQRRQRLLAKRRQQQQQQHQEAEAKFPPQATSEGVQEPTLTKEVAPSTIQRSVPSRDTKVRHSSGSSSSSESEEDSSSSSEDESSVEQVRKPLFVPKHKRNVVVSKEDLERQEEEKEERAKQQVQQRVMESRGLVEQQRIMAKNGAADMTPMDVTLLQDEGGGATNNPPPDDTDPENPEDMERERDAWEVRELQRLFELLDANKERLQEQSEEGPNEREEEERRRRHLPPTRKERKQMQEELFIRPKEATGDDKPKNFLQPFFHRGAYYMDETEFEDPNDVRFKAKEYARAATGDKAAIDPRTLPKVMQVKKFGFARQNTKYKGLAQEDTTDFKQETLPIRESHQQHSKGGQPSQRRQR